MTSRSQHYHNKKRHDQRDGFEKPAPAKRDTDTTWISEFVSSIQGISTPFNADSMIAMQLGETHEARELRLRELSRRGILRMYAYRSNGEFVEYRWELTAAGTL